MLKGEFSGLHVSRVRMPSTPMWPTCSQSPAVPRRLSFRRVPAIRLRRASMSEKVLGSRPVRTTSTCPTSRRVVSGYYTTVADQSKVISYYDDTAVVVHQLRHERHRQALLRPRSWASSVPIWGGISFNGALSLGRLHAIRRIANFTQTRRQHARRSLPRRQGASGTTIYVESTPQTGAQPRPRATAARATGSPRCELQLLRPHLPLDEPRRAVPAAAIKPRYKCADRRGGTNAPPAPCPTRRSMTLREQEKFDSGLYAQRRASARTGTSTASTMLGFSLEVKNILNDQDDPHGRLRTDAPIAHGTYVNKEGAAAQPIQYYVPLRFEVLLPAGDDLLPECLFPFLIAQSIIYEKS